MTTAVQDELSAFLEAVAYPTPGPMTSLRERVVAAVRQAVDEHGGYVHASWVRPLLGDEPGNWGSVYSALVSSHYLKGAFLPHGGPWWLPNGDTANKNGAKPARVYRLAKDIPSWWASGVQS